MLVTETRTNLPLRLYLDKDTEAEKSIKRALQSAVDFVIPFHIDC